MKRRTQTRSASAKQERREAAEKMNAAWRELTPVQQLAALDARLGYGVGATRQRARLMLQLAPKAAAALMSDPPNGGNPGAGLTDTPYVSDEKAAKKAKREAKSRKGGKK